uniref:Uncharacterized protein n=1 Tax=Leucocryptos marina TaxID=299206 RepID=A0A679EK08_LEUMA|nr:hypothetical protein [Leucocryptos marina]BBQ05384.1 hypothetical protein [Leucocryptos marina]
MSSLSYFVWSFYLLILFYSVSSESSSFWDMLLFSEETFIVLLFGLYLFILHMHRDMGTEEFAQYSAEISAASSKSYIDLFIGLHFINESYRKMLDYTSELTVFKNFVTDIFGDIVQSLRLESILFKIDSSISEVFEMTSAFLSENTFLFQRNLIDTLFYEQQLFNNWVSASNDVRLQLAYDDSEEGKHASGFYQKRLYSISGDSAQNNVEVLTPSVVCLLRSIFEEKKAQYTVSYYFAFFSDLCSILYQEYTDSLSVKYYTESESDAFFTNPFFISQFPTDFADVLQKAPVCKKIMHFYNADLELIEG